MKLQPMKAITHYEQGDRTVLKDEPWLKYLVLTKEKKVNLERINSMSQLGMNQTLEYVKRTLCVLETVETTEKIKTIVEQVLIWSEVAKGGMPSVRKSWKKQGVDLYAHNIGSAAIYHTHYPEERVIYLLILTHGLIGQFLRGETLFKENIPLTRLIEEGYFEQEELIELLRVLNQCVMAGVSNALWEETREDVLTCITSIATGNYAELSLKEKMERLRKESIEKGEEYDQAFASLLTGEVKKELEELLNQVQLWYIESALKAFSFEEFVKIFLLISVQTKPKRFMRKYMTMESFMNQMYYEHKGEKKVNIYKKRVIEKYLRDISVEEILQGKLPENKHVSLSITFDWETILFDFTFSPVGEKLIDFCVEAEKADIEHEKAIVLLFDLFELRRDDYDRFHNEEKYLKQMHASGDDKRVILDYVTGTRVLDVGPGSGVVLDMLEEANPTLEVSGIDISQNVMEALTQKKQKEGRSWHIVQGDALQLTESFDEGSMDTIIYSSIFHEFFSYIPFEGEKFNKKTIEAALKSGFALLAPGGRIIIRDGIMTDSNEKRIIAFHDPADLAIAVRYAADFKGRKIEYKQISDNQVEMPVNDAMEFLYTYTWGEESYVHEINEQFGYFTPNEYKQFICDTLGEEQVAFVAFEHYLQAGYPENLAKKIKLYNEQQKEVPLPDSTCFIVLEKK